MKLDLGDSSALKDIMAEALLRAVDEKTRDALIKQAIAYLLAPGEPMYHGGPRRKSPLEEAYKDAVEMYARRTAHEMVTKDERIAAEIRKLLDEALERAFTTHREATVERVANAIAEGLWKRDS